MHITFLSLSQSQTQSQAESQAEPDTGAGDSPWGHLDGSDVVDPTSFGLEDEACSLSQGANSGVTHSPRGMYNDGASSSSGGSSTAQSNRPDKRRQEENCADQKRQLLETAVHALTKSVEATKSRDECDDFGVTIAHALRRVPEGPQRQLASMLAYQAVVKCSLNLNDQVEIVQAAPDQ